MAADDKLGIINPWPGADFLGWRKQTDFRGGMPGLKPWHCWLPAV